LWQLEIRGGLGLIDEPPNEQGIR